jgi:putative endonuclease
MWFVYVLECRGGVLYTGIAKDVDARFAAHLKGTGARFTRSNPPLRILGAQPFADRSQALRAEHALKRLEKPDKLRWAQQWPAAAD